MKNVKKEQSVCQNVRRIFIEREDGTVAYDGKPDLCVCIMAEADEKENYYTIINQIQEQNVNPTMVNSVLQQLGYTTDELVNLGLSLIGKTK